MRPDRSLWLEGGWTAAVRAHNSFRRLPRSRDHRAARGATACRESDPLTIQRLREALDREANAIGEPRRWGGSHAEFHTLVVELSGSNTLAMFANIMSGITTAHTQAVWQHAADDREAHRRRAGTPGAPQAGAPGGGGQGGRRRRLLWRRHLEETTDKDARDQGQRELLELIG